MQFLEGRFLYAASDMQHFAECRHLVTLEEDAARGLREPSGERDEQDAILRKKGEEHARRILSSLQGTYADAVLLDDSTSAGTLSGLREREDRTIAAMCNGASIIAQATFFDGTFAGRVDFLRKVDRPGREWGWSYEPLLGKLARSVKPGFIIQLCHYAEHLSRIQGVAPSHGTIVLGDGRETRIVIADYSAYYRQLKRGFFAFASGPDSREEPYPLPVRACGSCAWERDCAKRRTEDDHLSLVASIRRDQIVKLESSGIATLEMLAAAPEDSRPKGFSPQTFAAIRRQARLQFQGRVRESGVYEFLESTHNRGFGLLPEPAPGDVFFDMEGDPFYEPGRGLEYLFGCWLPDGAPQFKAFWARDRGGERTAFEAFVDFIVARRKHYPGLRIYHYANYEKAALRRLAQNYGTREAEVDDFLRSDVLIDLYTIVRQSLVLSERSYGLKYIERYYGFKRETQVKRGDDSIAMFERWLDEPEHSELLDDIEQYNADDCRSTHLLRDWLLRLREEYLASTGVDIPFHSLRIADAPCHEPRDSASCKQCAKDEAAQCEEARRSDLERRLLTGIDAPQTERAYREMQPTDRDRYLLGHLLAYHRREEKPAWWNFFYRCENPDQLTEFDSEAIGGLELAEDFPPYYRAPRDRHMVYTYRYPEQTHNLHRGDVFDPETRKKAGSLIEIHDLERLIHIKRGGDAEEARALRAIIPRDILPTDLQKSALARIAQAYVDGTLERGHSAILDILRAQPRRNKGTIFQPATVSTATVSEVVRDLQESYLFIQGPPGSGKSTVAAQVICDLLEAGCRVGITSNGHKPVHHLLAGVERAMLDRGKRFAGMYKHSDGTEGSLYTSAVREPMVQSVGDPALFDALGFDLAGGTAWLFTRPALEGAFDYLFIDEAGQMSLADAIAVASSAKNVILLGDPLQLAQVSQGSHPLRAADSVLDHVLGSGHTIAPDRGIFLNLTYRLQPEICDFISESMYDGRLLPAPATALHRISSAGLDGAGLRFLPVKHVGNSRSSSEEADCIVREIAALCEGTLVDSDGVARSFTADDAIVVTPYNAQRKCIEAALRAAGITSRVGTVDKFQGQEAAVVFFSLASSGQDLVPRGVDFLYDANRLNVAISRARALAVLVGSPELLELRASSLEEMAAVSRLCRYAEQATLVQPNGRLPAGPAALANEPSVII